MSIIQQHKQVVVLDRDGVINQDSVNYIKHPDEWQAIPGSLEAIALLHQHGIDVHVATNQAGVAKGKLTLSLLQAIHEKMMNLIHEAGGDIKSIQFCPHHPNDRCDCRKPAPGMLLRIAEQYGPEQMQICYVGDSSKDISAAKAAGFRPVLVLTGNGKQTLQQQPDLDSVFENLLTFTQQIISE
jgi:D-glycero-D-manno-heptose 1,7-bisphosphate phosphatase